MPPYITSQQRLDQAVEDRVNSLSSHGGLHLIEVTRGYTDRHYDQLPVDVKTLISAEAFYERVKEAVDKLRDETAA